MDKKELRKKINELVKLYFEYNPQNNKGIGYRIKTNDIITSYIEKHGMTFDEVKECIEKSPMCRIPIWEQFYNFHFQKKSSINKEENSQYKKTINNSTNVDDWL